MTTTSGTPDADDVAAYLGPAAPSWTVDTITAVLAAERAAQARACRIQSPLPDDMREALLRRCAANLARRQLGPLPGPQGDAETPTIVPTRDPEVRRLEAPWRQLTFG